MDKLTRTVVEKLPLPDSGTVIVWDEQIPGFGARISATGVRTWVVRYRTAANKQRQQKVGRVDVLSADQARKLARKIQAEAAAGGDPVAARREARNAEDPAAAVTVRAFAERFYADRCAQKKSAAEDRRKLDAEILPRIGDLELEAVRTLHVQAIHTEIGEDRPIAANRVRALLSTMFEHAERLELRPQGSNPTRHVRRFEEKSRERFLSEDELARFGQGLERAVEERPSRAIAAAAIRLLALTGCRRNEILERVWDDFDPKAGILRLTDSKTGARDVLLAPPAVELVRCLPRSSEWIFPSSRGAARITDLRKTINRACELATPSLKPFRTHDLRHTAASIGVSKGMNLPIVGALLGHRRTSTTEKYAHLGEERLRRGAEEIQGTIARTMTPGRADPEDLRLSILGKLDGLELERDEREWLRRELDRDAAILELKKRGE